MIDPYILAGLAVFVVGFLLLSRTRAKRYLVFFMIETKRGIRFIDMFARISPTLWKFLGDVAIVISFGGIGSYYVSRYRNTWKITGLIGLACLLFVYAQSGPYYTLLGAVLLLALVLAVRKTGRPLIHFIAGAAVMGAIMFAIYPNFSEIEMLRVYVSVLVGVFGIPALLVSVLFSHALEIIVEQSTIPGVSPLLPAVSEEGVGFFFPGTGIFIPFWQALIAIIFLLVPHEFSHGVLTRCHKIKLKSVGLLTAGPVPIGAFVEPDNKEMEKGKSRERMRIYAAGSFANLITAILALVLLLGLTPALEGMTEHRGMLITNVIEGTPADGVLESGFLIQEINGMPTPDSESFSLAVSLIRPSDTVRIVTVKGTFDIVAAENPKNESRGYIGIDLREEIGMKEEFRNEYRLYADSVLFIVPTLFWIFFLCFNIALVNLLPIVPFDGGKMFEEIMKEFGISRKKKEIMLKAVIILIVMLLILNASPLLNLVII